MDQVDAVPRPRRQRPHVPYQNELKAKLQERRHKGLTADVTDSEEDPVNYDVKSTHAARPGSAKRRQNHSLDLSRGLGTTTFGSRDLSRMLHENSTLNNYDDDEDDEEIVTANFGKVNSGGSWQSRGHKTPSPKQESKYWLKKTSKESPRDQMVTLDSPVGRKTPTAEDIIFGRKTPTSDGKKSPYDRFSKQRSSIDENKPWQPPSYRSISPGSPIEQSRGSRGVTPIDSTLDTISESPREKVTPRFQRQKTALEEDAKPKPQARSRIGNRNTPPPVETQRTFQKEKGNSQKRSTPPIDLFGKSRMAAAQEVDDYIGSDKERKSWERKTPTTNDHTSSSKTNTGKVEARDKTPESSARSRFMKNSTGRSTPSDALGKQSPVRKKFSEEEKEPRSTSSSLLDILKEEAEPNKPKPKERGKRPRGEENRTILDDIFGKPLTRSKSTDDLKSPRPLARKTPDHARKSPEVMGQAEEMFKTSLVLQRPEDTSSLCEDIPPNPNKQVAKTEMSEQQTTERAKADEIINTIAEAQTMMYIEPARKMKTTATSAKVQHRPKPRYGPLPGESTKTLHERQFNSTGDIREAIYEEWYKERLQSAKQRKREEERKAKENEEKKKKVEEEKRLEAESSYRAWMNKKKETILTEHEKEEQEKLKQKEKEKEKEEKKMESVKSFESWKKKKDAMIKRELHKKEIKQKNTEEEKKKDKLDKQKGRESAYRGWVTKKEKEHIKKIINQKKDQKEKIYQEKDAKEELKEKEEEALKKYNDWIEDKERQAKLEKQKTKQRMLEEEYKPPWSPASRTIPFGR